MASWEALGIDTRGKASGEVKTTCPRCSASRKKKSYPCLNVNLDEGLYHCWHCGWSGSVKQGEYSRPVIVKTYRKPNFAAHVEKPQDPVVKWFAERGVTEAVLRRNMVTAGTAYFPQVEEERGCVMFPYRRRGEVVNVKYRTRDKLFRMEAGCERILYGLDDIGETLIWCEGEADKLAIEVAGITSCVSVPDGAPAPDSKSYESKFDFMDAPELARASTHVIAVDSDAPGQRLQQELIRRLGPDKCRIVTWPDGCKDANEVLVKFGVDILLACINDAAELPVVGAFQVADYYDAVLRLYRDGVPRGVSTGWAGMDAHYNLRAGDVTVITGAPNSGKSEWLDALLVNVANAHGWRFGIYSPEQGSPEEHIAKIVEKYIGAPFNPGPTSRISPSALDRAMTWANEHFDRIEPQTPTLEAILDVAKRLVLRRGVRGLVLDPWNEIEHARPAHLSETEYIGQSLRQIRQFARTHAVHVFIVAHPAKLMKDPKTGQYPVAQPYDISGSANWFNKPDVCISVWRERRADRPTPDVEVHVQKVRSKYIGQLGAVTLQWDKVTGRYFDRVPADEYARRSNGDA